VSTPSKPRKVLYCESNVDGTIGGSHYCLLWLVQNLDRAAFTPLVVFYQKHALLPRFEESAETMILPQPDAAGWGAGARGVLALPLGVLRRGVNVLKFLRRVGGYVSFLKKHDIALVHQNNSITRHHDWMLAALVAGIPCVAHERGINRHFSWLDRQFARRLKIIIPVSRSIVAFMVGGGVAPDNIRVLYDGLDPARVKPQRTPEALRREYGLRPDQRVIGIVGNVRVWKGQETVLRALFEVLKAHPDVVCFFVGASTHGDKAYQDKLNAMIAEADAGASVRFTGFQSDPASFVSLMSIVVHASIEPEPFGMVVLEAMAQRKPIVGSRAGGVVEMIVEGETGYTYQPGDHAELARRLIELLTAPERAAAMGEAGYRRLLESFSVQQYMSSIHSAYHAILDRREVSGSES
jgi:L-malate glycosyltransferase